MTINIVVASSELRLLVDHEELVAFAPRPNAEAGLADRHAVSVAEVVLHAQQRLFGLLFMPADRRSQAGRWPRFGFRFRAQYTGERND